MDACPCAAGTEGTLAGTAQFCREASGGRVRIGLTDPPGAALFRYYSDGELASEATRSTEAAGQGRITANLEGFTPDVQDRFRTVLARGRLRVAARGPRARAVSGLNVAGGDARRGHRARATPS